MKLRRLPSILLSVLLLGIAAYLAVAAVDAWTAISCTDVVGTCLRQRQKFAIHGIALAYTGASLWLAWCAIAAIRRTEIAVVHVAAATVGAWLAVVYFGVDPVEHLNNSLTGWLAAAPH